MSGSYRRNIVLEKIHVTICSGTACFVMGGADLLMLEEHLPEGLRGRVVIEGAPCLGECKKQSCNEAPFATVDGELVTGATIPILLEKISSLAGAK